MQPDDSIVYRFFCMTFMGYMIARTILLDYTNFAILVLDFSILVLDYTIFF